MKRTLKNKLLILFLALASLFVFGGCSLSEGLDEALNNRNLVAHVTYYSNGGAFGNSVLKKDFYYPENAQALEIGVDKITSGSILITRTGYELVGWYHVKTDGEGTPLFEDEATKTYQLGAEVDFSQKLKKDEHWIVAAKWRRLVGVKVVLVCEEGETLEVDKALASITEGKTSFKNGDELGELDYNSQDKVMLNTSEPDSKIFTVKDKTHTFLQYYADQACTQPLSGTLQRGETDITVYAKYITGNWTKVRSKMDVSTMFTGLGEENKYWIMQDIDCSGTTIAPIAKVAATIKGNGHTISGLNLVKTLDASIHEISLFGNILASAKLEDIKFTNMTMSYKSRTEMTPKIYGVFTSIDDAATIDGVHVSGKMSFEGSGNSAATNFTGDYVNCLFGGFAMDSEYTGGFTATIEVDGRTVTNVAE